MTPEQVELVQGMARRLEPRMSGLAHMFYIRLFAAHPDLRPLFPADIVAQERKFADEFAAVLKAISDFPAFVAQAEELGCRHRAYGVRAVHYGHVRDALLGAFAEGCGTEWSEAVDQAWAAAYDMVAEVMMQG